jgi:PKD repeat protein
MEWSNALARATASTTGGPPAGFGCVLDGADRAPVPAFTATVNGSTVNFDASATTDPDSGDTIRAYLWRFGDGLGSFDFNGLSPRHRYAAGGTYRVTLQVMDSHGATAVVRRDITVAQPEPAPTRSFKARLDENLDLGGFGSGSGTATRLGAVSEDAQLFWNFDDAPAAYHAVGEVSLTNSSGDLLSARYEVTLTDTASPPQGTSFTLRGSYEIQGGRQALSGATGAGTVSGTCTSSPERSDADCHVDLEGTIGT